MSVISKGLEAVVANDTRLGDVQGSRKIELRCWMSVITTWLHPPAIAASAVTIPMGPAPMTRGA